MSKSPSTISRSSPYKRTITYSKRDKARATPTRLPQTHSLPNTPTRQTPHASSSGNRVFKDVIDVDSDSDSDIRSPLVTTTRQVSQGSASSSRNVSKDVIDLSNDDSDTISLPAAIGKRLAAALDELEVTKKKVEKYEALTIEENTCETKAGHQLHSTTCGYCRAAISRPPILSLEWQNRVDDMALEQGIPIPERTEFQWPPPPGTPKRLRSH
ncbi:hypothetical protein DFH05DRAFT_1530981 [Lentinula detonsa]|uniref:Uncharacterized protein n=1 Tax=Lentinula detonsa TaxID=2804962 RepID=A0A9W8TSE1_9AGAR|nr:hypothetical protein DFH05DRAFT_1530981 [Lentinula detonsa]KAJ3981586.1 hypothetical protein F5890DRAFT_1614918 [Lentinula detonsa]